MTKLHTFRTLQADAFIKNGIGTEEQRNQMIAYAQSIKIQTKGVGLNFSNNGCWRHEFNYPDISWLMLELKEMVEYAIDFYMQVDPVYSDKVKQYQTPEISYWTNINDPGSRNAPHDHRLHHYVAVYYLQGKDTGDIVFHNPMHVLESCHPHAPFVSRYSYAPEDGDLIVFPAWVPHETEVNHSNRERINVAFNIRYKTARYI